MLITRAKIKPGQTVLIIGGGSGMGIAGIQIAKLFNCDVIATAGNKDKMDKCLQLGADSVINHREPDWYKKVREITNRQGVDVVYEHIGKTVFPQEVALLEMGGDARIYGCDDRLPLHNRPPISFLQRNQSIGSNTGN